MKFDDSRNEVNVIHLRSGTNSSHSKANKCTETKIIFFYIQFFITPTCFDFS